MSLAPTLQAPEPEKAGLWPVFLGALFTFTGCRLMAATDDGFGTTLIGVALLSWGSYRRWIGPKRRRQAMEQERETVLNDPARLQRLEAYENGSWFESVKHQDSFLTAPCTWYTPTPSGQIKERDAGTLNVNAKGLRLSGSARSLDLPFTRIVGITAKRDGLVVEKTTGPHLIIAVEDPIEVALACQAVSRARVVGKV